MISLFLNKIKVDLPQKPIVRKMQISDVGDIASIKSSYSYTLSLPPTSRNKQVLEMLGVIGNQSRKPYQNIACDYVVDEIHLVRNGIAIIKETAVGYNLNIIDGFKSLSDLLAGKKLSDLDLTDLNHELTTQLYIDSYSNTEGYIYAIADFGLGYGSGNTVKVEQQAPSLFVHTLISKIFEEANLILFLITL